MSFQIALAACAVLLLALLPRLWRRLQLSRAKHRSLGGHPRWARRLARLLPAYTLDEDAFFAADGAPQEIRRTRQAAFAQLEALYRERFATTAAASRDLAADLPDLDFTSRYRAPFPFSSRARSSLSAGVVLQRSQGRRLIDLDGNELLDLTGSYGVNLLGHDFHRAAIERATEQARDLGPVLGALHPCVRYNVRRLKQISGLDAVSFHMSGTEAVMQAVRLARYHTGRRRLVRFCGAYHGWWGAVQPGPGNPQTERDTLTLADLSARSLRVLRSRSDIACVLVNPVQALHPNRVAPGDSALVAGRGETGFDRGTYAAWLQQLREVCTARGIVLILDEVMSGFRFAPGGAQEYFGVQADLVTYGKSLGGGLPVGVLCGSAALMRRYREDRPADICFARGTFNSHPYVMTAMEQFLRALETSAVQALCAGAGALWEARAVDLNRQLAAAGFPVRVAALGTIWTLCHIRPSRYHWMLQYYLRAEGLALSWVGTGRFIFSLDWTQQEFEAAATRMLAACRAMEQGGWWWEDAALDARRIRRLMGRELRQAWWRACIGSMSSPRSNASGAR